MDFSDAGASGARALSRPRLSTEKQTTYEDTGRSTHSLREMHRFYRDERLCDVVIRGDHGARFPCHRLVLAASSLYFESMFSNDMSEARSTEITIKDVSGHALKVTQCIMFLLTFSTITGKKHQRPSLIQCEVAKCCNIIGASSS